MDDGPVFAGEDQGRLHSWAGGEVREQRGDMVGDLLHPLMEEQCEASVSAIGEETNGKLTTGVGLAISERCAARTERCWVVDC